MKLLKFYKKKTLYWCR